MNGNQLNLFDQVQQNLKPTAPSSSGGVQVKLPTAVGGEYVKPPANTIFQQVQSSLPSMPKDIQGPLGEAKGVYIGALDVSGRRLFEPTPGGQGGYVSRYEDGFLPNFDNEDLYGRNQSAWEVLGNGLYGMYTLAGNAGYNYFAQYARDAKELFELATGGNAFDKAWNDAAGKQAAETSMSVDLRMPIYSTKEMRAMEEAPQTFGSAVSRYIPGLSPKSSAYWGRLMQNFGYTYGTIGAYLAESAALGLATTYLGGSGGFANLAIKAPKIGRILKNIYKVAKPLDTGQDVLQGSKAAKAASQMDDLAAATNLTYLQTAKNAMRKLPTYARQLHAATAEGALEANMASIEFEEKELEKLGGVMFATPEQRLKIEERATDVGNFTLGMNIPILMASNVLTLNNIFRAGKLSKGYNSGSGVLGKDAIQRNGKFFTYKQLVKEGLATPMDRALNYGKLLGRLNVQEGLEEVGQGVASRAAQNYYALDNSGNGKYIKSLSAAVGQELSNSFDGGEGFNELVSGMLTGMGMSAVTSGVNRVRGVQARQQRALEQGVDQINKAVQDFANYNVMSSPKFKNTVQQANSSVGMAVAASENKESEVKDHRQDAKNAFFATARNYGLLDEMTDALAEQMGEILLESPELQDQNLSGETVDQIAAQVKQEGRKYDEILTNIEKNTEDLYNQLNNPVEIAAFNVARQKMAELRMNSDNSYSRSQKMMQELKDKAAVSSDAAKVLEVLDVINNPTGLNNLANRVEVSIEQRKQANEGVEMSKAERTSFEIEIASEEKYLNTIKALQETLLDEQGNLKEDVTADAASAKITEIFSDYQGGFADSTFEETLADYFAIEADGALMLDLYNQLTNKEYFEKYANVFAAKAKEAVEKDQETRGTKAPQRVTTISEQEFEGEVGNLTRQEIQGVLSAISKVTLSPGGVFTFNGVAYESEEAAQQAAVQFAASQSENGAEITRLSNIFIARANTIAAETEAETAATEATQEEATEEEGPVNAPPKSQPKKPLTREQIEKAQKNFRFRGSSRNNMLTHYFDKAVSRVYDIFDKYFNQFTQRSPVIYKAIEGLQRIYGNNITVTTAHLVDLNLPNTRPPGTIAETLQEDIEDNGYAVLRDPKFGRTYIFTAGDNQAAQNIILSQLNIFVPLNTTQEFGAIRREGPNGPLIESDIPFPGNRKKSRKQLGRLKKGDRVQVVVPSNQDNLEFIKKWEDAGRTAEASQELIDNLVIEFHSNGEVVGVFRSVDFDMQSKAAAAAISEFRGSVFKNKDGSINSEAMINLTQGITHTAGTVGVASKLRLLNNNFDSDGNLVWTSLADYNRAKGNTVMDVFVATSEDTITNRKGKTQSLNSVGRTRPFAVGAVYVALQEKDGGVTLLQAANDTASTYTVESLKDASLFDELFLNVKPGEPATIATRITVDIDTADTNGFSRKIQTTENLAPRKRQFKKLLTNDSIVVYVSGKVPTILNDAKIVGDQVQGRDNDNQPVNIPLKEVDKFEQNKSKKTVLQAVRERLDVSSKSLRFVSDSTRKERAKSYTGAELIEALKDVLPPATIFYLRALDKIGVKIQFDGSARARSGGMGGLFFYSNAGKSRLLKLEQGENVSWEESEASILVAAYPDMSLLSTPEQEGIVETMTHEIIHAMVKHGLFTNITDPKKLAKAVFSSRQGEFYSELENWRKQVAKALQTNPPKQPFEPQLENSILGKKRKGASLEELVTYALTNAPFAKWLETQVVGEQAEVKDTLWNRFKEIVRSVIKSNFNVKQKTRLDEINDILDNYVNTEAINVFNLAEEFGQQEILPPDAPSRVKIQTASEAAFEAFKEGATVAEQEQWIVENGVAGDTYTMPDGTEISVTEVTDTTITLQKGPNAVVLGIEQPYDSNEEITRGTLFEISEKENNGIPLTTREYIIKLNNMHFYKTLRGQVKSARGKVVETQEDFMIDKIKEFLSFRIGDVEGVFAMLSETYLNSVMNKTQPANLSELIDMTEGITEQEKAIMLDTLGYGNTTLIWAYVTQADRVFGYKQMDNLRRIIQGNTTDFQSINNRTNRIIFERTPAAEREAETNAITSAIGSLLDRMGIRHSGLDRMESMPERGFKQSVNDFMEFVEAPMDSAKQIFQNLVDFRTKFGKFGITVDFGAIVKTRKGDNSDVININDESFLSEFDDALMSSQAEVDIAEGLAAIMVKKENTDGGGMVEVGINTIGDITDEALTATEMINRYLESFDLEVSPTYVQAYLMVNEGDVGGMIARVKSQYVRFRSPESKYEDNFTYEEEAVPTTNFINEKKAQEDIENKTCK